MAVEHHDLLNRNGTICFRAVASMAHERVRLHRSRNITDGIANVSYAINLQIELRRAWCIARQCQINPAYINARRDTYAARAAAAIELRSAA